VASPQQIRPSDPAEWPAVWALLEPVFRAGETFPHDPGITKAEAQVAWVEQSQAVMVAMDASGTHVANAGYVVAERCRGNGIGSRLCQHSLLAAQRLSGGGNPAGSVSPQAVGYRVAALSAPGRHHCLYHWRSRRMQQALGAFEQEKRKLHDFLSVPASIRPILTLISTSCLTPSASLRRLWRTLAIRGTIRS